MWGVAVTCAVLLIPGLVCCENLAGETVAVGSQVTFEPTDGGQDDNYKTETGLLYRQGDELTDYMKEKCIRLKKG